MTLKKHEDADADAWDRSRPTRGVLTGVGGGEVMVPMTSVMQNYGLLWTDPDGTPQASAGRYDKRSAKHRRTELKAVGCTRVEIVPVRPGEVPEPVS
ncbi:hypothetical protein ACH47C_33655 [Streptomyces rishiriensis]|uniref:hypothetical protein n=4 Tax=Streptomyces TaxID=1883 RepID=UPI001FE2B1F6|nr:hypothetical protein [Streptomyces rishiriensis]